MSAAARQSIKTNQQRQIPNKGLGKRLGTGNDLPPRQRSARPGGLAVQHKHQSSGSARSKISAHALDCDSFSSIILADQDRKTDIEKV